MKSPSEREELLALNPARTIQLAVSALRSEGHMTLAKELESINISSPDGAPAVREALHQARRYIANHATKHGTTRDLLNLIESALSAPPVAADAVATKKTYIKPLRTIVEIDARYADQIRDLLNAAAPSKSSDGGRV